MSENSREKAIGKSIEPGKGNTFEERILTLLLLYRRSTEISLIIKQTFEAAIFTHLYPNSQIDIYIQVIQADGGSNFVLLLSQFLGFLVQC